MERTEEPTLKKCVRSGWWVWTNASRRYAGCAHRSASERKTDWGSVVVSEDVELQNRGTSLTYLYVNQTRIDVGSHWPNMGMRRRVFGKREIYGLPRPEAIGSRVFEGDPSKGGERREGAASYGSTTSREAHMGWELEASRR